MSFIKVKKDFITDTTWKKNDRVSLALIDVSYGYSVLDNNKIKIIPFVGLGITEFSENKNNNDEDKELRLVDYNLEIGINADYKFKKIVNLIPNFWLNQKSYNETSVRVKLFANRVNYSNNLSGYAVNLSVGISWLSHQIKTE